MNKSLPSFCTSNQEVLNAIIFFCKSFKLPVLIESTSNQVNQYGGYTKLTPKKFREKVIKIAKYNKLPLSKIIFGGDHLGPLPWKKITKAKALKRGQKLVNLYMHANFKKLHIDTTMRLGNEKNFTANLIMARSKKILKNINKTKLKKTILVLGSEVPPAGGEKFKRIIKSSTNNLISEIENYKNIFNELKIKNSLILVVDSGMSFNDVKVFLTKKKLLIQFKKLSKKMNVKYEAHSTDYQTIGELKKLVNSNFKYLKVGPELTFNFTRAILKMSSIENKHCNHKSNIKNIILKTLKINKKYWISYYKKNQFKKIPYGQYDRLRYYWSEKNLKKCKEKLFKNINSLDKKIILSQIKYHYKIDFKKISNTDLIINSFLYDVLKKYYKACNFKI